jgi:Ala-tRNA(Pro) deacylase
MLMSKSATEFFEKFTNWLNTFKISFEVIDHPPIDGTASGSSATTGTKPEQGAKALVMMVESNKAIMVVLRGPDRVDFKTLKRIANTGDLRLARPEEIKKATSLSVGALPPFGNFFGLTTYVDQRLLGVGKIACGAGLLTKTLIIQVSDFIGVVHPNIGDFAKE